MNYRCIIIGADAAGLEAAYELVKLGINPLVIDSSDEMERRTMSIEYGLRPYFKEPDMSEKINEIIGNIRYLNIRTDKSSWNLVVTRDDILGGREYRLRTLFRDVVVERGISVQDDLDKIILNKEKEGYRITAVRKGEEKDYYPEIIVVARRDFAVKNGMINPEKNTFFVSMEADFDNVYGRRGTLEYFYVHDALCPGGYILIEQLSSKRAHVTLRFINSSEVYEQINGSNFINWIRDNINFVADRLGTAEQITDTISVNKYIYDERASLSGDSFLVIGDAAGISEPLFGNSFPYLLYSGKLSAHVVESALESGTFTAEFLLKYDDMLRSTINPVMKSFQNVRDGIFCSNDKLNEFLTDVNTSSDAAKERFVESMGKYLYRKGLLSKG